jgi:hypothetical protein
VSRSELDGAIVPPDAIPSGDSPYTTMAGPLGPAIQYLTRAKTALIPREADQHTNSIQRSAPKRRIMADPFRGPSAEVRVISPIPALG